MKLFDEIKDEVYKAFEHLGADSHLLSIIGSWRDTLDENEILDELKSYNNGESFKVLCQSDDSILFDAEQKAKRKVLDKKCHNDIHYDISIIPNTENYRCYLCGWEGKLKRDGTT